MTNGYYAKKALSKQATDLSKVNYIFCRSLCPLQQLYNPNHTVYQYFTGYASKLNELYTVNDVG